MEVFNIENLEDNEALLHFLEWAQSFLMELVNQGGAPDGEHLFFEELREPMVIAWETVNLRFRDLQEKVENLEEETLRSHGLNGNELGFKFSTIQFWSGRFLELGSGLVLRRLLKAINTLLNSLLSATLIGTAISEFKDAVMDSVMD